MSGAPILAADGLSKKYARALGPAARYGIADALRELAPWRRPPATLRPGEFWALENVSFTLGRGEALAVIGANGAGKSTLLRLLAGLIKPDAGSARVGGRTTAMIDLAAGFAPALSGRENLRLGAALHGLTGAAAQVAADEAAEFAGLGEQIETPMQSYSAGMKARLAYALHAALAPDLMLVDEVLAVGDLDFQHKCLAHMRGFIERGGSLLFVSHSPHQIQAVCSRGLLLDRGRLAFAGTAAEALDRMFAAQVPAVAAAETRTPDRSVAIEALTAEPVDGDAIRTGAPLRLRLRYGAGQPREAVWAFSIWTADRWVCITGAWNETPRTLAAAGGELACEIPFLPLVGGRYLVRAALLDPATMHPLDVYGYDGSGLVLDVRAEPGAAANRQRERRQLVRIDVDWR